MALPLPQLVLRRFLLVLVAPHLVHQYVRIHHLGVHQPGFGIADKKLAELAPHEELAVMLR